MSDDIFALLNQAIAVSANAEAGSMPVAPAPTATQTEKAPVVTGSEKTPGKVKKDADGFPAIPEGFFQDPAPVKVVEVSKAAPMDRSDRLEKLVDDALRKTEELLDIPLIPGDDDFVKIASMQKDLVVSIINTGVKIDENRFKKRQGDALTGILAQLVGREEKLKHILDVTPTTLPN